MFKEGSHLRPVSEDNSGLETESPVVARPESVVGAFVEHRRARGMDALRGKWHEATVEERNDLPYG